MKSDDAGGKKVLVSTLPRTATNKKSPGQSRGEKAGKRDPYAVASGETGAMTKPLVVPPVEAEVPAIFDR